MKYLIPLILLSSCTRYVPLNEHKITNIVRTKEYVISEAEIDSVKIIIVEGYGGVSIIKK